MLELTEHEQLFFSDGYKLGESAAVSIKNEEKFFSHIESMHLAIDQLIDSLLTMATKQGISIGCKKGCEWCCHQAVYANSYEIHYLGSYIKKNLSTQIQKDIMKRTSSKLTETSLLDDGKVLNFKSPCPLLKNGACVTYHARPMACRIYLSTKVSSCIEFYKNPENKENYPSLLNFPLMAGRMMNEGFIEALQKKDIFVSEFRLEEGLEAFFVNNGIL